MRDLELRERRVKEIQSTGDRLLREDHPARQTVEVGGVGGSTSSHACITRSPCQMTTPGPYPPPSPSGHPGAWEGLPGIPLLSSPPTLLWSPLQAFQAALQTQWSWLLQLCCCIEAHLKENSSYFQVVLQEGWGGGVSL